MPKSEKKQPKTTVQPDWQKATDDFISMPANAMGWAEMHAKREAMGKSSFREWLASDEFQTMAAEDRHLFENGGDFDVRHFKLLTPENLRMYMVENGLSEIRPWHFNVMTALGKIEADTQHRYRNLAKSGMLDKKSIAAMRALPSENLRQMPLSTDLFVIEEFLDEMLAIPERRDYVDPPTAAERMMQIQGNAHYQHMAEPWRLVFGASFVRLLEARDIQKRLHRLHNVLPREQISKILNDYTLGDASRLDHVVRKMEARYDSLSADDEGIDGLSAEFEAVVDGFMNFKPTEPEETHEERLARRLAAIESHSPKRKKKFSEAVDADIERVPVIPKPEKKGAWGWLSNLIPGL